LRKISRSLRRTVHNRCDIPGICPAVIVFEYADVLSRKKFGFSLDKRGTSKYKISDETDKKFYELYKSGKVQYLSSWKSKTFS
jgi:hypothetical protein